MKFDSEHIDNLIARHLAGEASQEEREELYQWMDDSPENKKYFGGIEFVHDKAVASHRIIKVDANKAWQKLSGQMNNQMQAPTQKTIPLRLIQKTWFRVAASVVLLLGLSAIFYLYFSPSAKTVATVNIASADSITSHTFADRTQVTLNRGSKMTYKTKRFSRKRELELTGEAFIQVHHSADTPLIVKAEETFIRDIGTSFNVKAYPDKSTIEVYVESGEVFFYTNEKEGISLKKGESGIYDKVKKEFYKPDAVDINVLAYKSKLFVFRNTKLSQALSALNNIYTQKIELANPSLANCTITVTFDSESTEAIADIIAETLGLQLTRSGSNFVLKGERCFSQP